MNATKIAREAGWNLHGYDMQAAEMDGETYYLCNRVNVWDDYGNYVEVYINNANALTCKDFDLRDLPMSVIALLELWMGVNLEYAW